MKIKISYDDTVIELEGTHEEVLASCLEILDSMPEEQEETKDDEECDSELPLPLRYDEFWKSMQTCKKPIGCVCPQPGDPDYNKPLMLCCPVHTGMTWTWTRTDYK